MDHEMIKIKKAKKKNVQFLGPIFLKKLFPTYLRDLIIDRKCYSTWDFNRPISSILDIYKPCACTFTAQSRYNDSSSLSVSNIDSSYLYAAAHGFQQPMTSVNSIS